MKRVHNGWGTRAALAFAACALAGSALLLSPGSAESATPNGTPITIGYVQQQQAGPSGIDEGPVFAVWAKWINAQGGVNGHPVRIISESDPGDVAVALTEVQKLIAQHVDAIVDADANDAAWAQDVEKAGIPVFVSADTLAFGSSDDAFGTAQSPVVQASEQMYAAKLFGVNKLALLYCSEFPQCIQAVPFYQSTAKKYGIDLVYSAAVSGSAPNYLAQCLAAKAAGATILFVASTTGTTLRVVSDCAKQGYKPHLLGSVQKSTIGTPGTNGLIDPDSNVPFFDTSNPAVKTMTDALNKYNPSITKAAAYDDGAIWNWSNGMILLDAAKAAHLSPNAPVTAADLRAALFKLHTTTAGGLIVPITFTQGQAETNNCFYLVTIKDNKFTLPRGLKSTCITTSS
jgi:branched-chain amino acid transport system substrate-binding protein